MQLEKVKLSDTPSKALRQALADLEIIEKDDRYRVDMWAWHAPANQLNWTSEEESEQNKCHVCLAGAVLARNGAAEPDEHVWMSAVEPKLFAQMEAIDMFRRGAIESGLRLWTGVSDDDTATRVLDLLASGDENDDRKLIADIDVADYEKNPAAFKGGVWQVIEQLERLGL